MDNLSVMVQCHDIESHHHFFVHVGDMTVLRSIAAFILFAVFGKNTFHKNTSNLI